MSGSDRIHGMRSGLLALAFGALAACGADADSAATANAGTGGTAAAATKDASAATGPSSAAAIAATGATAASTDDAGTIGTQLLSHPDDLQMVMLGYRLRDMTPPLDQWAGDQHALLSANEFERDSVLKAERNRLQAIYDGTADVGRLRLEVRSDLSEYDGNRGGYYLTAFTPGSVFNFSAQPAFHVREQVSVRVENEEELNFWPLDAAAAQDALRRNNGMRSVTLDSRFRITGATQGSDGTAITVRLQRYAIVSSRYQQPAVLGERVFDNQTNGE